jgi:hypothetical protein
LSGHLFCLVWWKAMSCGLALIPAAKHLCKLQSRDSGTG